MQNSPIWGVGIGIDVGSTTSKISLIDLTDNRLLFCDYQRHQGNQPLSIYKMLCDLEKKFPMVNSGKTSVFITGSGGAPLAPLLNGKFVQEVNALIVAARKLYPHAKSIVELGGQDAKIVIFKDSGQNYFVSMNDKCAAGTGVVLDKCLMKINLTSSDLAQIDLSKCRLQEISAKCGVFAETDVINLLKRGVNAQDIICSLAIAIVRQNISVLTRGHTLKDQVLLLGGPNTFFPFLPACWEKIIGEIWQERGHQISANISKEGSIFVPANSCHFAAIGAVFLGIEEYAQEIRPYTGVDKLHSFLNGNSSGIKKYRRGSGLVESVQEIASFRKKYTLPAFRSKRMSKGMVIRGYLGIDGGSTSSKLVLVDADKNILFKEYQISKGNPLLDVQQMLARLWHKIERVGGVQLEIVGLGVTGYAANMLADILGADYHLVETVAHLKSSAHYFSDVDVICDIGGQDIKMLFMERGELKSFKLSNQCSAGNGVLLQQFATQLNIPLNQYADHAFSARYAPQFHCGCAVFLDTDRVNFQKEGYDRAQILAGLAKVLPQNVWQYVAQISRMSKLGKNFVLQGGTQYNLAALKAQVDYIKARVPDACVSVHPHPGEAGAIGVAFELIKKLDKCSTTSFIGLDNCLNLKCIAVNDESTRCKMCAKTCARTFVRASVSGKRERLFISGFACEKGRGPDAASLSSKNKARNLFAWQGRKSFSSNLPIRALPTHTDLIDSLTIKKTFLGRIKTKKIRRKFVAANVLNRQKRSEVTIAIPKCLNMWALAPFFITYFRTLGCAPENIIWSSNSSEVIFNAGGKYMAVDNCYPSKVTQAHIHELLFTKHKLKKINYIFFPGITHVPTFLSDTIDSASCPVVAGTPMVLRSSFTLIQDLFKDRSIEYICEALNFIEPTLLKRQLFDIWRDPLKITADENEFAINEGFNALENFGQSMLIQGREVLDRARQRGQFAILMLCRPYHLDPGINKLIADEFQRLGYSVLSIASLPKDGCSMSVQDVWPNSFSAVTAQKIWAARFAADNKSIAVVELSSFKCGNDATAYALIEKILSEADVPYLGLHDMDANAPLSTFKIRVDTFHYNLLVRQKASSKAVENFSLSEKEEVITYV